MKNIILLTLTAIILFISSASMSMMPTGGGMSCECCPEQSFDECPEE